MKVFDSSLTDRDTKRKRIYLTGQGDVKLAKIIAFKDMLIDKQYEQSKQVIITPFYRPLTNKVGYDRQRQEYEDALKQGYVFD